MAVFGIMVVQYVLSFIHRNYFIWSGIWNSSSPLTLICARENPSPSSGGLIKKQRADYQTLERELRHCTPANEMISRFTLHRAQLWNRGLGIFQVAALQTNFNGNAKELEIKSKVLWPIPNPAKNWRGSIQTRTTPRIKASSVFHVANFKKEARIAC